jgi:hypothetical protein
VHREARLVAILFELLLERLAHLVEVAEIPAFLRNQGIGQPFDGVGNIAHHFDLREIHGVHFGGRKVDMNYRAAPDPHEEGRFLYDIMAGVDDDVCRIDRHNG